MKGFVAALAVMATVGGAPLARADRAPVPAYRSTATTPAMRKLEAFLYEGDPYSSGRPPLGLKANEVRAYLAGALDRTTTLQTMRAVAVVLTRYPSAAPTATVLPLLDRTEATAEDVTRSIVIARIALAGGPQPTVATYYDYLVGKLTTPEHAAELILLYHQLGGAVTPVGLHAAIDAQINVLGARPNSDYSAHVDSLKLQETALDALNRAEQAIAVEATLAAEPDAAKRLARYVDLYVGTADDLGFIEYLQPWATAQLATGKRAQIAAAFRAAVPRIAKRPADEREFVKVRILHAIRFFGGTLSKPESKFLAAHGNGQLDLLTLD